MATLRELGTAIVEDIDYNALMYDRREAIGVRTSVSRFCGIT
jgi:hypothetical protein